MLTEEEKNHIAAAAASGTQLLSELKKKYIDQLETGTPFPGISAFECCKLPSGQLFPVQTGHCAILGGDVLEDDPCGIKPPRGGDKQL